MIGDLAQAISVDPNSTVAARRLLTETAVSTLELAAKTVTSPIDARAMLADGEEFF